MVRQWGLSFSHGLSFHVDLIGVVDQPVEYDVGQGGVADSGVPLVDGQLSGGVEADTRSDRATPRIDIPLFLGA